MTFAAAESAGLAPSLAQRRLQVYLLQILSDGAMLLAGFVIAAWLYLGDPLDDSVTNAAQLLLPLFWIMALMNQTYGIQSLVEPEIGTQRLAMAMTGALMALVLFLFVARSGLTLSRFGVGLGFLLAGALQIWARFNLQPWVRRRVGTRAINLMVIDDGGPNVSLPHSYLVDAAVAKIEPDLYDPHLLNRFGTLIRNMDRVIVTCPPDRREAWAMVLKGGQMRGEIVDSEVQTLGILGTSRTDGVGTLIVASGPMGLRSRLLKRALDLSIALPALVALAVPLLLIGLAIRLQDGGPALFKQPRIGRNNQFFAIYKFRTMRAASTDVAGTKSASREDDRITPLGAFLRRTSIDQIPQLLNVVKGDMSLVGPRPHALGSQAGEKLFWQVDSRYWQRHALKPGMSGLAQVRGLRGSTDTESDLLDRLQADLEYLQGWSIRRDIRILFSTLKVLVHDRAF